MFIQQSYSSALIHYLETYRYLPGQCRFLTLKDQTPQGPKVYYGHHDYGTLSQKPKIQISE